ncbi:hypothetical protein [Paenibacillus sp. GCM10028914]|uniref:hypothetical protein n=1 Tax=Paenibacillus sp. GCM10028914 TaxID=3273416 RepID=UPI00362440A6
MFRKMFLLALVTLLGATVLTGCNSSSKATYPGILIVNDHEYFWQGDATHNEFTAGEKIGEVQKKVDPEVLGKGNFSSNILEIGEEIYSTNEDDRVLIVKREDGRYDKFERSRDDK